MRHLIDFLIQFILALTGAIGFALAMAAAIATLGGCALLGSGWCWNAWRKRGKKPPPDR